MGAILVVPAAESRAARVARLILLVLTAVVAIAALGGATYGIGGADSVPRSWLDRTPFDTYLVPSIVLGVVVAGSQVLAAALLARRRARAADVTAAAGLVLAVWILVQVAMIGWVSFLQPTCLATGVVELSGAVALGRIRARSG